MLAEPAGILPLAGVAVDGASARVDAVDAVGAMATVDAGLFTGTHSPVGSGGLGGELQAASKNPKQAATHPVRTHDPIFVDRNNVFICCTKHSSIGFMTFTGSLALSLISELHAYQNFGSNELNGLNGVER